MRITESELRRIIKEEINNAGDNIISESSAPTKDRSPTTIKHMARSMMSQLQQGQKDRVLQLMCEAIFHLAENIEKINESK